MNTKSQPIATAFTPLRVSLMVFIVISILSAVVSYVFKEASWAYLLGIFSTVFILLVVFLQIMELIWLNSMRIHQTDKAVKKSYQKAINIYLVLLPLGIFLSYLVLLKNLTTTS
jgi:DMSO reductase anchor subunit